MNVKDYIYERVKKGTMHMTLLDPAKQSPEHAAKMASVAEGMGTDAIMVGGSTGVTQENLDTTILAIKKKVKVPVIYFPSGAHAISPYADAMYFMSMLNSTTVDNVILQQVKGAPIVKMIKLEPISMGYIIVEPGMKVGKVGKANPIPRAEPKTAAAYALAAEYMGMKLVYLEAGSGAPEAVPLEMIAAVKKTITVPLIVGGGIRDAQTAEKVRLAGADIVVTGTVVEDSDLGEDLRKLIKAAKGTA
ncbi:MAG: geranylgeranylglyceryl/heptaprenylglyceryl phosphate synthase [Methanomassiliicoccales archaeon]|nr:geranylgeranylglyceryl/heptaprenylglyceryl phosphate synthase [Methanomassiliicoccales archaeon]